MKKGASKQVNYDNLKVIFCINGKEVTRDEAAKHVAAISARKKLNK